MINGEYVLAVIPARGGSKRVPRKNIRDWRGKPLIAWSIEAARDSKYIDKIVLSTEDHEIAEIAKANYCDVIWRPPDLARDESMNEDVLRHVLHLLDCDWIVLLQPTSPLRTGADIDVCLQLAQSGDGCVTYDGETLKKNGAVYVARRDWILKNNFDQPLPTYLMSHERSIDLDYPEQFE